MTVNNEEAKSLVRELWAAGHKDEARELVRLRLARTLSQDDRNLQYKIFNDILNDLGVSDPGLTVDAKKGVASFYVRGMSIVGFPGFLERLLRNLHESGTSDKYKLDHIDRKDPMRVFIRI